MVLPGFASVLQVLSVQQYWPTRHSSLSESSAHLQFCPVMAVSSLVAQATPENAQKRKYIKTSKYQKIKAMSEKAKGSSQTNKIRKPWFETFMVVKYCIFPRSKTAGFFGETIPTSIPTENKNQ